MGFHRGPNLVTDNLKFALDAASIKSYPGSGTTVSDLVSTNNFEATNGPTFGNNYYGSITFDGTNDYLTSGLNNWVRDNFTNNQAVTIGVFLKPTGAVTGNGRSAIYANQLYKTQNNPGGFGINIINGNYCWNFTAENVGGSGFSGSESYEQRCTIPFITGSNTYIAYTWNGSNVMKAYRDGVLEKTLTNSSNQYTTASANRTQMIGRSTQGGWGNYFSMDWYSMHIYGKELSADEISQNYNAIRKRFDL